MDGKTIYIMAGAPTSGKDTVIEFMTKHVFQDITNIKHSMVLSYSFIDDSRARADLIGIPAEKTKAFRKFLSDDAENLDNFDPENRGYGYRVYRFIDWLEKNSDPRVACIMVNLRQMKGIIPMGKAVHKLGYRVRILKVVGRGLTPEEMSNEGDKEYLSWPDDAFHYVFDNSGDLDYLENQIETFVKKESDEIERNKPQQHIAAIDAGANSGVTIATIFPVDGTVEFLPASDNNQITEYMEKTRQQVVEAMSPSMRKVELKDVPNFTRPGSGYFNSEHDFALPKPERETFTVTSGEVGVLSADILKYIKIDVAPVLAGTTFDEIIKERPTDVRNEFKPNDTAED